MLGAVYAVILGALPPAVASPGGPGTAPPQQDAREADELVRVLRDGDASAKVKAMAALNRAGRRAVPPLRAALRGPDPGLRAMAVSVLGWLGADARPALPDLLAVVRGD